MRSGSARFCPSQFSPRSISCAAQVSKAAYELPKEVVTEKWIWLIPAVLGLIVTAYVLGPMVRLFRAMLDGRRLPDWLFTLLLPLHVERRDRADSTLQAEYLWQGQINLCGSSAPRGDSLAPSARSARRQIRVTPLSWLLTLIAV